MMLVPGATFYCRRFNSLTKERLMYNFTDPGINTVLAIIGFILFIIIVAFIGHLLRMVLRKKSNIRKDILFAFGVALVLGTLISIVFPFLFIPMIAYGLSDN